MNSPDQHTLLRAIEDARRILEEYIGAGPRDPAQTLHRLLVVLDKAELVHPLDRISHRRVMRLLENTKSRFPRGHPRDRVSENAPKANVRGAKVRSDFAS